MPEAVICAGRLTAGRRGGNRMRCSDDWPSGPAALSGATGSPVLFPLVACSCERARIGRAVSFQTCGALAREPASSTLRSARYARTKHWLASDTTLRIWRIPVLLVVHRSFVLTTTLAAALTVNVLAVVGAESSSTTTTAAHEPEKLSPLVRTGTRGRRAVRGQPMSLLPCIGRVRPLATEQQWSFARAVAIADW